VLELNSEIKIRDNKLMILRSKDYNNYIDNENYIEGINNERNNIKYDEDRIFR
jgi:hypothetical protein